MRRTFGALAAFALLTAQAAPAAEWGADGGRHSGVFAGAYVRLPLTGPRAAPSPARAGLRLSVVHQYRDAGAPLRRYEADALDLRFGADARPSLHLAGQPLTADRFGYADDEDDDGGFKWWIPVAAVTAAALIGGAIYVSELIEEDRRSD